MGASLLVVTGCHKHAEVAVPEDPVVEEIAAVATWTPSASQEALVRMLSGRDGAPPCADVEAVGGDVLGDLIAVVDHVQSPPWVGMRAANCVLQGHAGEAAATLELWVTDPELAGLGLLVLGALDQLEVEQAVGLAAAAIERGPDPEGAKKRVLKSEKAEIRAVVDGAGGKD